MHLRATGSEGGKEVKERGHQGVLVCIVWWVGGCLGVERTYLVLGAEEVVMTHIEGTLFLFYETAICEVWRVRLPFLQDFFEVYADLITRVMLMIYSRLILPTLRIHHIRLLSTLRRLLEVRDLIILVVAPCLLMLQARFRLQLIAN